MGSCEGEGEWFVGRDEGKWGCEGAGGGFVGSGEGEGGRVCGEW